MRFEKTSRLHVYRLAPLADPNLSSSTFRAGQSRRTIHLPVFSVFTRFVLATRDILQYSGTMTDRRDEAPVARVVLATSQQQLLRLHGQYGLSPNAAKIRTSSFFQNPSARAACCTKVNSASRSIWIPSARAASPPLPSRTADHVQSHPMD